MVKEIRVITQSHIPPDELQSGRLNGYSYPPYTFFLERRYYEKAGYRLSVECYKDGVNTHTVIHPHDSDVEVEVKFTQLIESYVEEVVANAEIQTKSIKEKLKKLLTREKIRDILGM